jgi:protein HIRA/HIR1
MHIVKPAWAVHLDENERTKTIYSISLHPDGSRLATGGIDTKIKIWSTKPIINQEDQDKEDVPKLLSTLTAHEGVSEVPAPINVMTSADQE